MVFTIARCGFVPRCALEADNGGARLDKIVGIIADCPIGIHDISRTELDEDNLLPRFNMPFELGVFVGAVRLGSNGRKQKSFLVLDRERYRYQKYLSDIAGLDIRAHEDDPLKLIKKIRDFLLANVNGRPLPSGQIICTAFQKFERAKPVICSKLELDVSDLTFLDFSNLVAYYLKENT